MARYYSKRRRYDIPHAVRQHMEARRKLSSSFGGIDIDVEKRFLSLTPDKLRLLLEEYKKLYGEVACDYAKQTYKKWQSGKVKMSGQTAERLLNLVPHYISYGNQIELIEKLRSHYIASRKTYQQVETRVSTWREDVNDPIDQLMQKNAELKLPDHILKIASWLVSDDSIALRVLAALEQEESLLTIKYLDGELGKIAHLVANTKNITSIEHLITLPQGDLNIIIKPNHGRFISLILNGFYHTDGKARLNYTIR